MEILWCTKAPRADIYSQFVSALRTTAGASSADRVGRSYGADRVVRPYTFCAGRRTPRAFVPLRSTAGRRPLHTLSLRASPRREASALGVQTGVGIRLSSPPSEREVSARSADGGRDATRFPLPQSAAPTAPSQRGPNSAKRDGCRRLFLFSYTAAPRR